VFETGRKEGPASEGGSPLDKTVEKKDQDPAGKGKQGGDKEDVLNYFEKKFEIKE
jgi:hypothetical protein